jgi:hypothetical protein
MRCSVDGDTLSIVNGVTGLRDPLSAETPGMQYRSRMRQILPISGNTSTYKKAIKDKK